MSGCINKERYMRRCYNSVLGEYYYIDILRERLRCQQEWIKRVHLYYRYKNVYKKVEPDIIYIPFAYDVHTDHQIIARALQSTFKWFRYPHIKKVYMYETPSETEFNFGVVLNMDLIIQPR